MVEPLSLKDKVSLESRGKDVRRTNLLVVRAVAECVKSSLGPRGLDKMLIDPYLNATITNDGSTILRHIEVSHPAAKMLVDVARTTHKEVGDGTTSVIVLASELLSKAQSLVEKGIHPTIIESGYRAAMRKALQAYSEMAIRINPMDRKKLKEVAMTAIAGKNTFQDNDHFASLAVEAVLTAVYRASTGYKVDLEYIGIEKKHGGSQRDSTLVRGLALNREVVHPRMPKIMSNARIAILNRPLAMEKKDVKLNIESPEKMQAVIGEKGRLLEGWVKKIASCGANVVVCRRHIDDLAKGLLARRGILAVAHVRQPEIHKLARASRGRILEDVAETTSSDLGSAEIVEERKLGSERWVFIEGCRDPRSCMILIRGGTKTVVDEYESSVRTALSAARNAVENPKILPGGGASEVEVAARIRVWAEGLATREQLPAMCFADALEEIPCVLAKSASMDPIDTLARLRASHRKGEPSIGVDVLSAEIDNTANRSIYDTLTVKEQVVKSAVEVAVMIARIDQILASTTPRRKKPEPSEELSED